MWRSMSAANHDRSIRHSGGLCLNIAQISTYRRRSRQARSDPVKRPVGNPASTGGSKMQCQCREPSLNELMRDPIIRAVMARDAVEETALRRMLDRVGTAYWATDSDNQRH